MNVLVTGGTGFIGSALCRELDGRGHDVTALARTPDDAAVPDGVETYAGDVTDYDSIEGAFDGQDAVVNLVAPSPLFKPEGGEDEHLRIHLGGTENVVAAAEEYGIDRIVQQSSLGADPGAPQRALEAKGKAEAVVRDADLEWVITRPSVVFGEGCEIVRFTKLVTTPYVTAIPGGGETLRFQLIWRRDLVPILADCVDQDERAGEAYEFGGPEVQTLAEITKLVYRAEGKPVTIVPVPMPLAKVGMSAADYVPFVPLGSDQYYGLTIDNVPAHNDVEAFGVDPADMRTFADWLGLDRGGDGAAGEATA